MEQLRDRVAVVTGGASGIGLALARTLAAQGMRLVLADIEEAALTRAVAELRAAGAEASGVRTDVSSAASVEALAKEVYARHGAAHLLCNNAGVFAGGLCWEASEADYRWVLGVNLWGVIHGIRAFVPRMIAGGQEGYVLNVASMAGFTATPFAGVYHTSKHAVVGLSECLYHDLALHAPQIGVSLVCPEMIRTGIGESARNRPAELSRDGDMPDTDARRFVEDTIRQAAEGGLDPSIIASRSLAAIRERRFYVLGEDGWMDAARSRMADIAAGRNPVLAAPG
jgi:NAD(P)-dependent dehydrogenase (short-subunit alcohol dehydrogenase family)